MSKCYLLLLVTAQVNSQYIFSSRQLSHNYLHQNIGNIIHVYPLTKCYQRKWSNFNTKLDKSENS